MKTFLVRLQILTIILLVFSPLIYLGIKKLSPQINLFIYDFSQKNTSYPPISPLHTQGTKILNDKDEPVILRGINLISTNWGEKYDGWNPQAIDVAVRDWHINIIRTRIYQNEFEANPAKFFLTFEKEIFARVKQHGLYVIVHPWFSENESFPDNGGTKMWLAFANRYKDNPHLIYDLLAEPRDTTFTELQNTYLNLIPQIRSLATSAPIMATGLDWGRDINAWLDSPLPYDNIIYRSNPYNKTAEFPAHFGAIAEQFPVFLGEFGTQDKLSMTESDVKDLLGYADALGIGWTAWHFTSTGCPCLLENDRTFVPSSYGQLVKDNLLGKKTLFTLPTFDTDPDKLYVYSDFLESGFSDYSWGLTNQLGQTIKTNFHAGAGIFFSTSRRIQPNSYKTFNLTFSAPDPSIFTLRFKSWDNQLSDSFSIKNGINIISTSQINLETISGIVVESVGNLTGSTPLTIDNLYFYKN